jgi:hypothetical protein
MLFFSIFAYPKYKNLLMKAILKCFLIQLVLLSSISIYAQVGIGTTTPDASSALDISSTAKGLLMPRLTSTERDNISLPAAGLVIFNTSSNDVQLNVGSPSVPSWIGVKRTKIDCVTSGDIVSTTSTSDVLVPSMTVFPESGTYIVSFNADISIPFSSAQGVIDINGVYQALLAMPGGVPHGLVFGSGEVLSPGVYDVTGATSIAGMLTMDGGGDPNSMFIIRSSGAFTTGETTTNVVLTNGASANNIFWLSEITLSTGAGSIMKGTLVSAAGAIALGVNTNLEGRILTKAGGLSIGAGCVLTVPSGASPFDLGVLSTFAMFTSSGTVLDTAPTSINGDVGSGLGAITISGTHFGNQYSAGTAPSELTMYCLYQNGVEVVNSRRTIYSESSLVSLQAKVTTLNAGESIEVRWKVHDGTAELNNRTLSLIRSGN